MAKQLLVELPFAGFYDSLYSDALDREEEQFAENEVEKGGPLEQSEYQRIVWESSNFRKQCLAVCESYVSAYADESRASLGWRPSLTFESMQSPREYNFSTDRIHVWMPVSEVRRLFKMSKRDGHRKLADVLVEWFTPRSGFMPFYSRDIDEWLRKPVTEWDHNELSALLTAMTGITANSEDMFYATCDGGLCSEWEEGVDWEKYERKVAEAIAAQSNAE